MSYKFFLRTRKERFAPMKGAEDAVEAANSSTENAKARELTTDCMHNAGAVVDSLDKTLSTVSRTLSSSDKTDPVHVEKMKKMAKGAAAVHKLNPLVRGLVDDVLHGVREEATLDDPKVDNTPSF